MEMATIYQNNKTQAKIAVEITNRYYKKYIVGANRSRDDKILLEKQNVGANCSRGHKQLLEKQNVATNSNRDHKQLLEKT